MHAQYKESTLPPPPPIQGTAEPTAAEDSTAVRFPVKSDIPTTYDQMFTPGGAMDLDTPDNITTYTEYDYQTGRYVVRTKLGDTDISTPFMLTADEYSNNELRKSMTEYYRMRNAELVADEDKKEFDFMNMNFSLGPLEKIFGPGGVQLKMQGTVQLKTGMKTNRTDNPAVSVGSRTKSYFDFDQTIQASINASVGDKMDFKMTYNTDATFDFDSQNLKLQFEGEEDDIIKNIEAGNVSMTTGSSLIKGSTSLFGVKATMQFGKLTATALVSQQNAESQTVNSNGGAQTTSFTIKANEYDADRHYFLSHYFREHYDEFASSLPYVMSGINITKIEVWVTNKRGNYDESRNIVGFMDLGENRYIANDYWKANLLSDNPSNSSNNLLALIKSDYPGARNINSVNEALAPLAAYGIDGGEDYAKLQNAQLLSSSDYTLNASLGYISLKSALNSDEVLAVAFEYTYKGTVYKVGEFSSDITSTNDALYVKMLKSTTADAKLPMWRLMMKNVYSLGAYQLQEKNFKLDIKYLSDSIGTEVLYLPVGKISSTPLLQVMNLDKLDATDKSNPDGFFDYIDGYTVNSSTGRVIFPVAEPFGAYLEEQIGDPNIAKGYVYKELYDSILSVAEQLQEKNKFVLTGEYQASSGSQISLNAMNVSRGSVVVTAGGATLVENSDYTVDYNMGIVTIINQSIIDSGANISVSLENQSMFSMQRKTLLGLDLNYEFSKNFNLGGTIMHFSEKAVTEKVSLGNEVINNTIWGLNLSYNKSFMWLTNALNAIPTVNATAPSSVSLTAEFAQLVPHKQQTGTAVGSSYLDDFEAAQTGIDLRSPYSWFLSATPYDNGAGALFPEAALSNNLDYGKNRALLAWYYIDDLFTEKNSTLAPGYIKNDVEQQSNPYVREITYAELYPDMDLSYGQSSVIQTLNLSFYPNERGPYNLDSDNIDALGNLLNPEQRWGGIMRKLDNTNFETSNIEYITFWMLSPFLDDENPNYDGGDLYFNLGDVSEDVLKDGMKSYENGVEADGSYMAETVWGKVSAQTSLTYAFDSSEADRVKQDVGLDGLHTDDEHSFATYRDFVADLRLKLPATTITAMEADKLSVLNDPAGDNYHFYRGYDYDAAELSILERYKRYNGVEGNSLSANFAGDPLYQSSRSVPDVEDINQDNTLNEYERYYQYHISIRPDDFVVGRNFITDKQVSTVTLRNGERAEMEWYQFKIPIGQYSKVVGSISDFSSIRFVRMFMTGFKNDTHLRFATLELIRGDWRAYEFNLNNRTDATVSGTLDVSTVNIEENAGREPVNYVLPPGVTRVVDSSQSQVTQLNEQSLSMAVTDIDPGDARGVYKDTHMDLRMYKRLQMYVHAEALIDDVTNLEDGDISIFVRMGSDVKNNYYEYEIPLTITPEGKYSNYNSADQYMVWPLANQMDCELEQLVNLKSERVASSGAGGVVSLTKLFSMYDPNYPNNKISILGNPSLSNVSVILVGVRNNSSSVKDAIVWVNELKVTDFNEDGGWAAKGNLNLAMSDIATVNVSAYTQTDGFGSVDQSLTSRATDNLEQYNVAVQADLGRLLPESVKLKSPVYYSVSNEKITPKYNPLDQDVLLKDALDAAENQSVRDSIKEYAINSTVSKNLSISGFKFDVQSKKPMPWDPANFTLSYSSSKQKNSDSTTEFENQSDYRGSLDYSYSPYVKGWKPFNFIKSKSRDLKFVKDWELNYLPTSIGVYNNISRYYYEQQSRNLSEVAVNIPVSVSKNFVWDRELSLTWNLTKQLSLTFNSNTLAYIQEAVGAVNRDLYPTEYEQWRDTVWNSIKSLGDPREYNQNFVASYKLPFSKIPSLNFISGSVSYNSSYDWEMGTKLEGIDIGNTISNQSTLSIDGKLNLEQLYNKSAYLKKVNSKFSSNSRRMNNTRMASRARKFTRTFMLKADEPLVVKHNMKTKSVKVTATTTVGKPFPIKYEVQDANNVKITTTGKGNIKVTVTEVKKEETVWSEIGTYAARVAMSIRSLSFSYRGTQALSLPQFVPTVGDVLGQNNMYSGLTPGLGFAFGFAGESYIEKAKSNGWLLCDDSQTSPAIWSDAKVYNFEVNLEPISGLKIKLTANQTDNRTTQNMFMYDTPTKTYSGSYVKTHCAIATSLYTSSPADGYQSDVFDQFLKNIDVVSKRVEANYAGSQYPSAGFLENSSYSGKPYSSETGGVRSTSSDVTIPAMMAAYTGRNAENSTLSVFPSLASLLPNWRVTYDGLVKIGNMRNVFKSFSLSHAYQCTYAVGSFSSYTDWVSIGGDLGFIQDEITGAPIPSSPYEISSVALTEKFSPLIGVSATLQNNITFNVEYNDGRTLTLSSSAGQLIEAKSNSFVIGAGYKIANFNTILKIGGSQKGVSNDLTINLDFSLNNSQALIRNIEHNTAQASSGTRTLGINFLADYILSKRVTVGAYYDLQSNNPLVSSSSYPTSNSNYGVIVSLSLAR